MSKPRPIQGPRITPRIHASSGASIFCKRGTLAQFMTDNVVLGEEEIAIVYDATRLGRHVFMLGDGVRSFQQLWGDGDRRYWQQSVLENWPVSNDQ